MVDSEKLRPSFYLGDDVTDLAMKLLGKILWTNIDGQITSGIVVETEAYSYLEGACHAHMNRRTKRTETLFAEGGTAYVYLCYGIHHLFNIVTNRDGIAEAVLIRAVEPYEGKEIMQERRGRSLRDNQLTSGPGKLSQALGISTRNNSISLLGDKIWLSHGITIAENSIIRDVRIGVDYAGEDALLPWRFLVKDNPYISVKPQGG